MFFVFLITGVVLRFVYFVFFFNYTATTEIYTLSLHDALPIPAQHRFLRGACGLRHTLPGTVVEAGRPRRAAVVASLLDLEDAQRVLAWVDDPRCPGKPDVGDAVLSLQARHVILLNLDAA